MLQGSSRRATFITEIGIGLSDPAPLPEKSEYSFLDIVPEVGKKIAVLHSELIRSINSLPSSVSAILNEHARELALVHQSHLSVVAEHSLSLQDIIREEESRAAMNPRVKELEEEIRVYQEELGRLKDDSLALREGIESRKRDSGYWEQEKSILEGKILNVKKQNALMRAAIRCVADADVAKVAKVANVDQAIVVASDEGKASLDDVWTARIQQVKKEIEAYKIRLRAVQSASSLPQDIKLKHLLRILKLENPTGPVHRIESALF